jgi:hypothetical protein
MLVFVAAFCSIVSRRPDAIFNAQFFAEDGKIWYAQAYDLGWLHSLVLPYAGYFVTVPRIVAGVALLFPLRFAPLIMNVLGIAIQAFPVSLLLSERCSNWGKLSDRALYAAVYIALPNMWAIDATITNAQWHLALICCLLLLGQPIPTWAWRIGDFIMVSLSALTGPFCILLLPVAAVCWWKRKISWPISLVLVLASVFQAVAIYQTIGVRYSAPLGASGASFIRILAGQVYLGAILGSNTLARSASLRFLCGIAMIGTIAVVYSLLFARIELKLYQRFGALLLASALTSSLVVGHPGKWDTLIGTSGAPYWFLPMVGFAWSLIWCFRHGRQQWIQVLSAGLLFSCASALSEIGSIGPMTT